MVFFQSGAPKVNLHLAVGRVTYFLTFSVNQAESIEPLTYLPGRPSNDL